jgi:hypothetical protein
MHAAMHTVMNTAGPLLQATLIVDDAAPLLRAYAALGLLERRRGRVDLTVAQRWGQPQLADAVVVELGSAGMSLLRLIEQPGAKPRPTRHAHGWLALEILVRDVDALAAPAAAAGFEVVGAPADLELSPNIRAMQLIGPAGEMLYLTQVKAPVPPFELPLSSDIGATHNVDRLFIAVMSTPSRAAAIAACADLAPRATLQFETKVTVLNRAFGRAVETRWPLATLQWAGASLFEIDEVQDATVTTPAPGALPMGLAWVSMQAGSAGHAGPLRELAPGAWLELTV